VRGRFKPSPVHKSSEVRGVSRPVVRGSLEESTRTLLGTIGCSRCAGWRSSLRSGVSSALRQPHEHRPVKHVHVFARDLHGFRDIAGAQGGHQRDVVAV
jgi:hypothetical protein